MLGFFILLFFFFSDIISVYKVLSLFSFHLFLFGTRFSPRFVLSFSKVLSFSVPQVYFLSSFLSSLSLFSLFFFVVVVVVLFCFVLFLFSMLFLSFGSKSVSIYTKGRKGKTKQAHTDT